MRSKKGWSAEKSKELYGIGAWGEGYFDISDGGDVIVLPDGKGSRHSIGLNEIISGLKDRGINMPVLLRFSDILNSRIRGIHESFSKAIHDTGYKSIYRGVYPVKVNQQHQVLQDVTEFGRKFHHGLEVGSKAELIAAIPFVKDSASYLICNGYKDEEFMTLVLYARKIGINAVIILETQGELGLILRLSKKLRVEPKLGVRVKLSTKAEGRWTGSGGDRSPFGLDTTQIIQMLEILKDADMLGCFSALHYHIGSQISNIRHIRTGVVEACRVYAGLVKEGAPMGILDLGGGLAVDYDGSHTSISCSSNYTLDEYCADVIEIIMSVMDEEGIDHPVIVTESGRSLMAYSSILLFNILDVSSFEKGDLSFDVPDDIHEMIHNLSDVANTLSKENLQECYNDALFYRGEIFELFKHGVISLRDRALGEEIYHGIIMRISDMAETLEYVPEDILGLNSSLADIYYANFSVFQSLPDAWAIGQTFPILPVHRLNEKPVRRAILADLTCDCDGRIDTFISRVGGEKNFLPLHEISPEEEYILGIFLVGAYQETLGDLHNLLGDTNIVSIRVGNEGEVQFFNEIEGDSVADVLSYVEFDTKFLMTRMRKKAEEAVQSGKISVVERKEVLDAYEYGLRGYTYFEK